MITASYPCLIFARGSYYSSINGYVAARPLGTGAYSCVITTSDGDDFTAVDNDIPGSAPIVAGSDACTVAIALGSELSAALDGQRLPLRHMYAGALIIGSLDMVFTLD